MQYTAPNGLTQILHIRS
nr:unnamed protein product [Callosobruchus analis]